MNLSPKELRTFILNTTKPYVLKGIDLQWHCFQITIDEWCSQLNGNLDFECASYCHHQYPQWEFNRYTKSMDAKEFLKRCRSSDSIDPWMSYGYKDLKNVPDICRKDVNFDRLGFDSLDDISFWLGSTAAHTPCHYDTYGCNIVVQVYGK